MRYPNVTDLPVSERAERCAALGGHLIRIRHGENQYHFLIMVDSK